MGLLSARDAVGARVAALVGLAALAAGPRGAWAAADTRLEANVSASVVQADQDSNRRALGAHGRFTAFWGSFGLFSQVEWLWHPLYPIFSVGGGWRTSGEKFYFELDGGFFYGDLSGLGMGYVVIPSVGYFITSTVFISVPVTYNSTRGIYDVNYMPFIGIKL